MLAACTYKCNVALVTALCPSSLNMKAPTCSSSVLDGFFHRYHFPFDIIAKSKHLKAELKHLILSRKLLFYMRLGFTCLSSGILHRFRVYVLMRRFLPVLVSSFIFIIMNICGHINSLRVWSCTYVALSAIFYNADAVCCCNW